MEQLGDIKESCINYFHDGGKDEVCILYTSKKTVMEACIKRNPPIKVEGDEYGWQLYYHRDQLRTPAQWLKVAGKEGD